MKIEPDRSKNMKKKYDCTRAIYAAMAESSIYKDYAGDGKFHITNIHSLIMDLYMLETFVQAVVSTTEPAYLIDRNAKGASKVIPTSLGNKLGRNFQPLRNMQDRKAIESEICGYLLSPNVNLYFDTLSNAGFWFVDPYLADPNGKLEAEYFNELVDEIRKNSKNLAYRNEQKGRRKQAADNHKSLSRYIKALFDKDHYDKLVVIRLDLAYTNEITNLMSVDIASAHRAKFLGNRYHNKIFDNLVGYAWGLFYHVGKGGFYHQFLLFFDRATPPDVSWDAAISRYWSGITDGKGRCQSLGMDKFSQNHSVGVVIDRGQADDFIERVASILSKGELFFSLKYGNSGRTFRTFDKGKISPKAQRIAGPTPN